MISFSENKHIFETLLTAFFDKNYQNTFNYIIKNIDYIPYDLYFKYGHSYMLCDVDKRSNMYKHKLIDILLFCIEKKDYIIIKYILSTYKSKKLQLNKKSRKN